MKDEKGRGCIIGSEVRKNGLKMVEPEDVETSNVGIINHSDERIAVVDKYYLIG